MIDLEAIIALASMPYIIFRSPGDEKVFNDFINECWDFIIIQN